MRELPKNTLKGYLISACTLVGEEDRQNFFPTVLELLPEVQKELDEKILTAAQKEFINLLQRLCTEITRLTPVAAFQTSPMP